jgi:two-component system sensor histidine kinase BarA
MLIGSLASDISAINASYHTKNYREMGKQLHKLHGALCYCGLPRLKNLVAKLETDIKHNSKDTLPALVETLNKEVNLLIQHYSQ